MYCTVTYTFSSYFSSGYKEHESMFCMKLYVCMYTVYSYTGTSWECLPSCMQSWKKICITCMYNGNSKMQRITGMC